MSSHNSTTVVLQIKIETKDFFKMIYFSTWMYEESQSDGGYYFQVGGEATNAKRRLIYWRCVLLFFTLAHQACRNRPDVSLCLFTNANRLPKVDGVDLNFYLESLGVKIIQLEYHWRPEFPNRNWYNQFYVFDILDYFEVHGEESDLFIVADSDCLVVDDLTEMLDEFKTAGYLTMDVGTTSDENINGLTRREAASFYGALGGTKQPLIAPYFGGEFFGVSGQLIGPLLAFSRDAFHVNNRRAKSGQLYLSEEAHLLSYAFVQLGVVSQNADRFLRRIWTTWKSNNTRNDDLRLVIWHVPAEKIFGIKTLASRLAKSFRRGRTASPFTKTYLSYHLGVGSRRFTKLSWSLAFAMLRRIREKLIRSS